MLKILDLISFSEKKLQSLMTDLDTNDYLLIMLLIKGFEPSSIKEKFGYSDDAYKWHRDEALKIINEAHEFYMNYNDSSNHVINRYGGKDVLEANLASLSSTEQLVLVYTYNLNGDCNGGIQEAADILEISIADAITIHNSAIRNLNLYMN